MTSAENFAEARATLALLAKTEDKVILAYTVAVAGRTVAHRDANPVTTYEASVALDTLESIGAELRSIAVYRHED